MNTKKSRILYIKQFLETRTDEEHPATMQDILAYLDGAGIQASRKAVMSDISQLIDIGVDVVCNRGKRNDYFIGMRQFELPELKLLIDAVQASRIVSERKTRTLIDKLSTLASVHQAECLNHELYIDKTAKTDNERVYITIDLLNTAINGNKQVSFKYYEYDRCKRKVYKHNRQEYLFSPYNLIWNNSGYYIVGYSQNHDKIIKFRVDRIAAPYILDKPAVPKPSNFNIAVYSKSVFSMYDDSAPQTIKLKCENSLMKTIVDRFGKDVDTSILDDTHFTAGVPVAVSPAFYGWVFSFAGKMCILAPEDVRDEYALLASIAAKKTL